MARPLSERRSQEPVEPYPSGGVKSFNRSLGPDEDLSPDALRILDQMGRNDERRLNRGLTRAKLHDALRASKTRSKEESSLRKKLRRQLDELLN